MDRAGGIGNFLNGLPGYRGYRNKEDRRDADRVVREQIATELENRAARVDRIASGLAARRELSAIAPVNAVSQELRLLATRVRTASYGYGGLFGNRDVNEAALAQLRSFDETLLEGVASLEPLIVALEVPTIVSIEETATASRNAILHLSDQFNARSSVVETAEPSSVAPALPPIAGAIDEATPVEPHPAYDLHDRDAVEILGDSYVVDARIEVSGPETFRLFRLQRDPSTWLLTPRDPSGTFARLVEGVEFATGDESGDGPARGAGSVIGAGGEQRDVPVRYTRATIDGKIALLLDWSGERQSFVGSEVHPDDIVIYGSTLT